MANRSLVFRLAVNVLIVLLSSLAILSAFVLFRANIVSSSINEKSLETYIGQIEGSIHVDNSGHLNMIVPEEMKNTFSELSHDNIYIVKSESGSAMWASHSELEGIAKDWQVDKDDGIFVSLKEVFPDSGSYYGISRQFSTPYGNFVAMVAQSGDQRDFARYILSEFIEDIAWTSPVFIFLMVGTVVATIRWNLRVLSETSAKAALIDPNVTNVRLPITGLPREIAPLVNAVNGALDRLETRFALERQFTANSAHELRTPLSILKARVDKLSDLLRQEDLDALKQDIDRMARVVSQLLAVARLEMPGPARQRVVMNDLIKDVVGALAPLALAERQELAAILPEHKVCVDADYAQLEEALRNLVENAITHCPRGTEIEVSLENDGTVRVIDNGLGICAVDRERIFERFVRGSKAKLHTRGAGLGLCIAREIAQRNGGLLTVEDTPDGGATFVLTLPVTPD